MSAALLVVAAAAAWFLVETWRPRQELAKTGATPATQEPRGRDPQQQVASGATSPDKSPPEAASRPAEQQQATRPSPSPPTKSAPAFASLVLTVGGTRSAAAPPARLVIPAGTKQVRLQLRLRENNYTSYSAVLRAAGGEEIYAWPRLNPRTAKSGASLALTLPAREFGDGDYVLTLRGVGETGEVEDVSQQLFRVERKR